MSLNGSKLSFTINNPLTINPILTDLTVILNDQKCINLVGTFVSFTCDLPINVDNTPILVAGSYFPSVTLSNIGELLIDPGVNPIIIPFYFTSISNAIGGLNGGYEVTIVGKGFPLNSS